jgi:hypothetical protein
MHPDLERIIALQKLVSAQHDANRRLAAGSTWPRQRTS